MSRRCLALALAVALGVGGCGTLPEMAPAAVERELQERFELVGRMAVTEGQRSASMGIEWRHGVVDEWLFLSPLGQVVARIEATAGEAVLHSGGQAPVRAASAQELMARVLGIAPPLEGVAAWVQGVPRDGAQVRRLDAAGRPARVADAGWIIDYLEYAGPEADARPRRLEASWGDARMKLVIDQWARLP
jgi:outer membrane lipoprotein LolB